MTGKRMVTYHLARTGLLEPFRRTLMCLQLRHSIFPGLDCDFLSLPQRLGALEPGNVLLEGHYQRPFLRATKSACVSALGSVSHKLFHIDTAQMQVRQLGSHFGQLQLSWSQLVASSTTEFLEPFRLLSLLRRALVRRYLDDYSHCRQHPNASFESLRPFLAFRSETKLPILAYGVAALATASVKHILGEFLLAFVSGDHSVQCGACLLRRRSSLGRSRLRQAEHDSCEQGRVTQNHPEAIPSRNGPPQPHTIQTKSQQDRRSAAPPMRSSPEIEIRAATLLQMDDQRGKRVV